MDDIENNTFFRDLLQSRFLRTTVDEFVHKWIDALGHHHLPKKTDPEREPGTRAPSGPTITSRHRELLPPSDLVASLRFA